jgi:hypothetical protein
MSKKKTSNDPFAPIREATLTAPTPVPAPDPG